MKHQTILKALILAFLSFSIPVLPGVLPGNTLMAQTNRFINPSFENNAALNVQQRNAPTDWRGFAMRIHESSSPDQQPGVFGVTKPAHSGKFYAGIVSRPPGGPSNGWESMGQNLVPPLEADVSYTVLAYLCFKPDFQVEFFDQLYLFQDPIPLSFYLHKPGGGSVGTYHKLGSTSIIDHSDWRLYSFTFRAPVEPMPNFVFSAEPPNRQPLGSNILIDEVFLAETSVADSVLKTWLRQDSIKSCTILLPNLLIRGSHPENALFRPPCHSILSTHSLKVFNRWGEKVFEHGPTREWWRGDDQAGNPLPEGVYFYEFRYSYFNEDGFNHRRTGWIKISDAQ